MELHYKCTTWCKIKWNGKVSKKELIKKLKEFNNPLLVCYDGIVKNLDDAEWEAINDTEEYLHPEENDGQATIELMDEVPGKIGLTRIWDNSIKNK